MKKALSILVLLIGLSTFAQTRIEYPASKNVIANKTFKTFPHCFTSDSTEEYTLTKPEGEDPWMGWGNSISFTDSTFTTSYSAPCGVDCFTTVTGTYKYVGVDRIQVYVESIQRNGFCTVESEEPKKNYGIYTIEKSKDGLKIVKA